MSHGALQERSNSVHAVKVYEAEELIAHYNCVQESHTLPDVSYASHTKAHEGTKLKKKKKKKKKTKALSLFQAPPRPNGLNTTVHTSLLLLYAVGLLNYWTAGLLNCYTHRSSPTYATY
jgi:hypothetical protein